MVGISKKHRLDINPFLCVFCLRSLIFFFFLAVPSYKLITPSVVSERLKIRGSLARFALIELEGKGQLVFFSLILNPTQIS